MHFDWLNVCKASLVDQSAKQCKPLRCKIYKSIRKTLKHRYLTLNLKLGNISLHGADKFKEYLGAAAPSSFK